MKKITTTGIFFLISFSVLGQEFQIGFKTISTYDSSRTYKPNTLISDKLHYRPVDVDLWYPADIGSSDTVASFSDLVYLLEHRSNFYDDTKNYNGLAEELLQYICAGVNCSDADNLKQIRTNSYVNPTPVAQKFPLVIYLAGLNGMSYENYLLFEALVKNGFVVASVSSIGRYPGNMTMDIEDVAEQINDAKFIINALTKKNFVSGDVGLVGYSWGGLAAALIAMTEQNKIKAVVSLDGSEQLTYVDEEENGKLNRIREADAFKPEAVKASFLYLDSDVSEWENLPDSIYNITDFISGDKCYLKINSATHEDFTSLSVLSDNDRDDAKYYVIQELAVNYLLDKLKGTKAFYENLPPKGITKYFLPPSISGSVTNDKNVLSGRISDKKSNLPLPFVNIGILNKDRGTTSNSKGEFDLSLFGSDLNDTLRISMVGYEQKEIYLKDIFKKHKQILNIQLQEKTNELKEIFIVDKKLTTKVLGNKTDSKFFGGKFASGDLGSEIAIRINIKDTPTYLETFRFNISYNMGDTARFRVNIYDVKTGLPNKNILTDNVILSINGNTGKIEIDLSKYNVVVNDDFFIALEWIEGKNNSGIVFSAGFANKGTYYRKASQGRWKKYPMGVGFNVTAKY